MRAKVLALEALQALARLRAQRWLVQAAAGQGARARLEALAAGGGGAAQAAQLALALQLRAAVAGPDKERREQAQTAAERALVGMPLTAASRTWPVS